MSRKKPGRPRIEIDFAMLEELCGIHCTRDEICGVLGIDNDTLSTRIREQGYKNFSTYHRQHSGKGKKSLRRMLWNSAEGGNIQMQIHLAKQYLGQSDKLEQKIKDVTPRLPQFIFTVNESTRNKDS